MPRSGVHGTDAPTPYGEGPVGPEPDMIVCAPAMIGVFDQLARLARSELPVLIVGETGVGKENAARAVHHHSARSAGPFVAINCATLSEALADSQLFGHDRGAFTSAIAAREGVFEAASTGTLFLDEIGELTPVIQAKLLRVLETSRTTRIGEVREREIDVRIVAATNRTLEAEVAAGRFRQDLYFRIAGAEVAVPPLRERPCEIAVMFERFVARAARRLGVAPPVATATAIARLEAHAWPGNIRELKHVAEYVAAMATGGWVQPSDLPRSVGARRVSAAAAVPAALGPRRLADEVKALEPQRMVEALAQSAGARVRAAELLGMPRRTFTLKAKRYAL